MRWEKEEGMPVRRLRTGGRHAVYAYPSELEAWRAQPRPSSEPLPKSAKRWLPIAAAAAPTGPPTPERSAATSSVEAAATSIVIPYRANRSVNR